MASASYYGANYTIIDNEPAVASFVEAIEWGGNVKCIADTFTATAGDTGSAASQLFIGKVPKNSIPLFVTISGEGQISWTGTVGYSTDPDAYGHFPVIASGGGTNVTGPAVADANTPSTVARDIYITTATASLVSGDKIATSIVYIQAG